MLFWHMAWRNVWRYRRRSLLTVLTIALGLAFNILMRGIGDGFHEQMVDNSVRAQIGHIEIHRAGYQHDPGLMKTLPDVQRLQTVVPRTPHLRGYSFRVLGDGLASTAENSAGVRIEGIDPEAERGVTTIDRAVIAGKFLSPGSNRPVLIGERLSQSLAAHVGDKVVLLVQAADGSMGAQLFRVAGIFRSGSPELDRSMVYVLRQDAQLLFSLGDGLSEVALLLDSSESVQQAKEFLDARLADRPVEVLPWYVVEPFLRQFIELDDAFFYIIVLILFIVISVGILNTVMMSVFERVREFGVMMALGVKPRQVVRLVVLEAAALAVVGVVLGVVLGGSSTLLFAHTGIDLSSYSAGASALGITTTVVRPLLTPQNLIFSALSVMAVVLLVALYPAYEGGATAAGAGDPAHLAQVSDDDANRTDRRFQDLQNACGGACAHRCESQDRARRFRGGGGPFRIGQDHAAEPDWRDRHSGLGQHPYRRAGRSRRRRRMSLRSSVCATWASCSSPSTCSRC